MKVDIDKYDLLYWLEGCGRGSHLRQGIWQRAVDEFYDKLSPNERLVVYVYAKRDLTEIFVPKKLRDGSTYQSVGHEDFFQFLARFNPANQYKVHIKGKADGKDVDEWIDAYHWNDRFYTKFNRYIAKERIVEVEHLTDFDKCNFFSCMWHEHCARWDMSAEEKIGLYANSKCDWFINDQTEHGADFKHFEI